MYFLGKQFAGIEQPSLVVNGVMDVVGSVNGKLLENLLTKTKNQTITGKYRITTTIT